MIILMCTYIFLGDEFFMGGMVDPVKSFETLFVSINLFKNGQSVSTCIIICI